MPETPVVLDSFGRKLYVNAATGNDARNSGERPTRAKATIQAAINAASAGDTIIIAPGDYNESLTVSTARLTLIGEGGRGSVAVAPQAAGAEGLRVTADDVTLINVGVAGDDTADYALNVSACARFRAYECKFEKGSGAGAVVLLDGSATDQAADVLFDDCEFAYGGSGLVFDNSAFGYPTQIFVQGCRFHNLVTAGLGLAAGGGVVNLQVRDCVFDNAEDGTPPTDYILVDRVGDTGIVTGCRFATPTNEADVLTVAAGILWVANATEAGISTARPS